MQVGRFPYRIKAIGASFRVTKEWEDIVDAELEEILVDKFTRNKYCKDFLLSTGNKNL